MQQMNFGLRLRAAMDEFGPLCVGIDPHPGLLTKWGLPDDVAGLRQFSLTVMDAVGGRVAAVKPQSALFERFGSAGVAVLEEVIQTAREMNTLSIVDAKRGDIGSTMEGYAAAYLHSNSPLAGDAVTLSPFLGFGSLQPALDMALANGKGVFILCLTSNPEGAAVQHAINPVTGQSVASQIAQAAAAANREELQTLAERAANPSNSHPKNWQRDEQVGPFTIRPKRSDRWYPTAAHSRDLGSIGLVVGATIGNAAQATDTDLAAVNGPLLAPGVGAQGGGTKELREVFGPARPNVLASSSREILNAGPDKGELLKAAQNTAQQAAEALQN